MMKSARLLFVVMLNLGALCAQQNSTISRGGVRIDILTDKSTLWRYSVAGLPSPLAITPPQFEIDGRTVVASLQDVSPAGPPNPLPNGVVEYRFLGRLLEDADLSLGLTFRVPESSPVVRFHYELRSTGRRVLTKQSGQDNLQYFSTSLEPFNQVKEVRLSEFYELPHTYRPSELIVARRDFEARQRLIGPLLVASNGAESLLLAYEHGSQVPDAFVEFQLGPTQTVALQASKGNYCRGTLLDSSLSYTTLWMDLAAVSGTLDSLAHVFRAFVLRSMSANAESRKPYIFYNTWNFQERNKDWNKQKYLTSMNLDRMLEEIEVAHRMGIDVFVIDAGWFSRTGDWPVDLGRFPDGMRKVKARLDQHGMKLGLWFTSKAAISSHVLEKNRASIMSTDGKPHGPSEVWETEKSYVMCMVSPFSDAFADELIRLGRELGVTYFKWDAFDQYGCNAAGHWHGTDANSAQERAESYSFQLPFQMARVADRICAATPNAIVDFDITEGERAVGLAFLSAGKYFIINNGPYYYSLDDPQYGPGGGMGANVLVFPGIARAANARVALEYDRWIPSVLFMTHYLPDDPEYSQWLNLGSLILGQNGVWGDLPKISEAGVQRFQEVLSKYKTVRDDITEADPVQKGETGGIPEIREKVNRETGKGVVVIFYNYKNAWKQKPPYFPGRFRYVTQNRVSKKVWKNDPGAEVTFDRDGRAIIDAAFDGPSAKIIFFGAE